MSDNYQDLFDREYTIPAITLCKKDLENFDNVKKLLDDLKIISGRVKKKSNKK